jgi:hypothetical protein
MIHKKTSDKKGNLDNNKNSIIIVIMIIIIHTHIRHLFIVNIWVDY